MAIPKSSDGRSEHGAFYEVVSLEGMGWIDLESCSFEVGYAALDGADVEGVDDTTSAADA